MKTGRVYKIIHTQSDIIYIGSTINTLRDRFKTHKSSHSKCVISKYIQEFGSDQFKIILIKEYEVVDKNHLEAYEQLWINKTKCINHKSSFKISKIYMKEYRDLNKDTIREQRKEYRDLNKEKIKEYQKEYRKNNKDYYKNKCKEYYELNKQYILEKKEKIKCDVCKCLVNNIYRHNKTQKHLLHCK